MVFNFDCVFCARPLRKDIDHYASCRPPCDSHLAQAGTILDCPFVEPDSIGIACYTAITNRFTAEQAHNLPPAQKALEDAFRANMGNRRHMAESPDGLKIKR